MRTARATRLAVGLLIGVSLLVHAPGPVETLAAPSTCGLEGVERVVAVGDVHGAFDRFVEILRTAGLIDARQRWAGGHAHLVQLGDVVDRGPDSRKVLDFLRRLEKEASSAGGAVHPLLGNHEVARMLGDMRYTVPGEYAAFMTSRSETVRRRYIESAGAFDRDELLRETPLGLVEMRSEFGRNGDYGKWLRTLDTVVKIDGVLFMHGGISPNIAPRSCSDINNTIRREMSWDLDDTRAAPLESLAARTDGPLWYRGLAEQPDTFAPQVDEILARQSARGIVVAHTVIPEGRVRVRFGGKVVLIDTGMQPAYAPLGRASALEIRGGEVTAVYQDRRDVLAGALPLAAPPTAGRHD